MNAYDAIAIVAEQKIQEALAEGLFDNLPGAGQPLMLEDLSHLPPESRMAYSILKNSGYLSSCENSGRTPEQDFAHSSPEEEQTRSRMLRLQIMLQKAKKCKSAILDALPRLPDSLYLEQLVRRI